MSDTSFSDEIAGLLPGLRRYARALTGAQGHGDALAMATLEAILADRGVLPEGVPLRVALFGVLHAQWTGQAQPAAVGPAGKAQERLEGLAPDARAALLLSGLEGVPIEEVAVILRRDLPEVEALLAQAVEEVDRAARGRIMIIEDESIIAMDISAIVSDLGHTVTGIARTREAAVDLGKSDRPDLILADIQLADRSSGIDAVNELLAHFGDIPVIFITAFPERLLTGARPEPAFLIAKPYAEDALRTAVAQAMFVSSTALLGS